MTPYRYSIDDYAAWVRGAVFGSARPLAPEEHLVAWQQRWRRTDAALMGVGLDALFELLSLVVARWESLGALYRGTVARTNVVDALAYSRTFLEPVQPRYASIHDLTGRRADGSDFFTMVRNKPLHGMTVAATAFTGDTEVVAWWAGVDGIEAANHLAVDALGKLHVSGRMLSDELATSLDAFIAYLETDRDRIGAHTPKERWRRAYWARFTPRHVSPESWMQRGERLGIPA